MPHEYRTTYPPSLRWRRPCGCPTEPEHQGRDAWSRDLWACPRCGAAWSLDCEGVMALGHLAA
jgi:hypothetical protein